ncbi:MAG: hypothetical protein KAR38_00865 [Calditrichia bacterium]|nr:hypothetical protein [Calditrichia bacterium]
MVEFFEKLNKGVSQAAEKIDIWTQIGKLKLEKRKVDSRLNKVYSQFGKKIYSLYEKEGYSEINKEEVSANLSQIEEILNEQLSLKEKIELLKAENKTEKEENID